MKTISIIELCKQDFTLKFLDCATLPQSPTNPVFSCISQPKKQDMLLYLNDSSTQYITKDKKVIETEPGNLVYVPTGSEYVVKCTDAKQNGSTFQVYFHLFDEQGDPVRFSNEIVVFKPKSEKIVNLFNHLTYISIDPYVFPSEQKSILYNILTIIGKESLSTNPPTIISKGVEYIHAHYQERPKISHLAKWCYITPEYFRLLFKNEFGVSPTKYINKLRIESAANYLIYSELSVAQIGEMFNYPTTTHFISQFKSFYKMTPLSYRNQNIRK